MNIITKAMKLGSEYHLHSWVLESNLDLYLSTTGDDANDGLTPTTAKGTWNGMASVLRTIDHRQYTVTVHISGLFSGDCNLALTNFDKDFLILTGSDQALDGFSGTFVTYTDCRINLLRFGRILNPIGTLLNGLNSTIRITGLPTPTNGMSTENNACLMFAQATIEFTGNFTNFIAGYSGFINLYSASFVAIDTPTVNYIAVAAHGADIFLDEVTYSGSVTIANTTLYVTSGSSISNNSAFFGNTYAFGAKNLGSIQGTATCAAQVSETGALLYGFGINSIVKTANGRYTINHQSAPGGMVSATPISSTGTATATVVIVNPTQTQVYTANLAGGYADYSFAFIRF